MANSAEKNEVVSIELPAPPGWSKKVPLFTSDFKFMYSSWSSLAKVSVFLLSLCKVCFFSFVNCNFSAMGFWGLFNFACFCGSQVEFLVLVSEGDRVLSFCLVLEVLLESSNFFCWVCVICFFNFGICNFSAMGFVGVVYFCLFLWFSDWIFGFDE